MFHKSPTADSVQCIKSASKAVLAVYYQRCLLKLKKCSTHIWFLKQCKAKGVSPKHMKIQCNHKSAASQRAITTAYKTWLVEEEKFWQIRRENIGLHLKLVHSELLLKENYFFFQYLDRQIRETVQEKVEVIHRRQAAKLQKLIAGKSSVNHNSVQQSETEHNISFYHRIVNLSNIVFTSEELDILSKGLKYSPEMFYNQDRELLAVNTELALNSLENVSDLEKHKLAKIFSQQKLLHSNKREQKTIKSIKRKLDSNDLILCKADKGNTITILTKLDYNNKILEFINNNDILRIPNDPTNKYQQEVIKTIKRNQAIFTNNSIFKLRTMNPMAPLFYGLPKIHKQNCPIRPVVSYVNAPSYKLCKELNTILPNLTNFNSKYSVKNSFEFINNTKSLIIPKNAKLVSFDVCSLFSSIPVKDLILILDRLIENSDISPIEKTQLKDVLKTCISQNYFQYNNVIYIQKDGLPMGSPISPLLAEIFMSELENQIFKSNNHLTTHVAYWTRYVDDIFCIWNGTERNLKLFLNHINSFNSKIQFTMEMENNGELNFLDVNIKRNNNYLKFNIHRKTTYTDTIIHRNSHQSWQIKLSPFHSMIHRLLTFPLDPQDFKKEVCTIKQIAKNNGYKEGLIDNIIKNKQKKKLMSEFYNAKEIEEKNYRFINYIPKLSDRISKELGSLKCRTISVNKRNLSRMLVNNKDKIDEKKKSGVYKISCNDCNAIYIGQSGRNIKTRVEEHKKSLVYNIKNTGFSTHCIENNHFINLNNVKLLHNEQKGNRLNLLEQLEIKKSLRNNSVITTNDQQNFTNTIILNKVLEIPG